MLSDFYVVLEIRCDLSKNISESLVRGLKRVNTTTFIFHGEGSLLSYTSQRQRLHKVSREFSIALFGMQCIQFFCTAFELSSNLHQHTMGTSIKAITTK